MVNVDLSGSKQVATRRTNWAWMHSILEWYLSKILANYFAGCGRHLGMPKRPTAH